MVEILALVLHHDEQAVLTAVELALEAGVASKTHVLDVLHWLLDGKPMAPAPVTAPQALCLATEPQANVLRYDSLRGRATGVDPIIIQEVRHAPRPASAAIVIVLRERKMHGMANAVDELTEQGSPAFEAAQPMLSQLLKAKKTKREVRSVAYQLKLARFPAYRDLIGFDFAHSEVNKAWCGSCSDARLWRTPSTRCSSVAGARARPTLPQRWMCRPSITTTGV